MIWFLIAVVLVVVLRPVRVVIESGFAWIARNGVVWWKIFRKMRQTTFRALTMERVSEPYENVRKLSACNLQNTLYNVDIRRTIKKRE